MTTMLLTCRVADYDAWRERYERAVSSTTEVLSWRVWRGEDDPQLVVVEETFESREFPERFVFSDEIRAQMAGDGVDLSTLQVLFLRED